MNKSMKKSKFKKAKLEKTEKKPPVWSVKMQFTPAAILNEYMPGMLFLIIFIIRCA